MSAWTNVDVTQRPQTKQIMFKVNKIYRSYNLCEKKTWCIQSQMKIICLVLSDSLFKIDKNCISYIKRQINAGFRFNAKKYRSIYFRNQGGEMLYVQRLELVEDVKYPLKPPLFSRNKVTSRKSKNLWTKGPEWNNAAYEYEKKEKYHKFKHPTQDYANSRPHFNKRERMMMWEMEKSNTRSKKKVNKEKKQEESQKKAD